MVQKLGLDIAFGNMLRRQKLSSSLRAFSSSKTSNPLRLKSLLQALQNRLSFNQRASGRVNEDRAFFELIDILQVNNMLCVVTVRKVQGNNVRAG